MQPDTAQPDFYFLLEDNGALTHSRRILATPSHFAREHFLYVQEVGSLQNVKPHTSRRQNLNSYLFFIVLSGRGIVTYQDNSWELAESDCVFFDCKNSYSHTSSTTEPWRLMWVHFNGTLANYYYEQLKSLGRPPIFHTYTRGCYEHALDSLYQLHKEHAPMYELASHQHITDIVTACLMEQKPTGTLDASAAVKLKQVRAYIDAHFSEKLSLDMLAERFFISKYHLSREFKKAYGVTIGSYLLSVRLGAAKQLLRYSKKPIEEIALLCGIADTSYFTKVFKKSEHMTALEYRHKWTSRQ